MLWKSFYLSINSAQVVGSSRFSIWPWVMSVITGGSETSLLRISKSWDALNRSLTKEKHSNKNLDAWKATIQLSLIRSVNDVIKTLGYILHNSYLVNNATNCYLYQIDICATKKCLLSQLMLNSHYWEGSLLYQ